MALNTEIWQKYIMGQLYKDNEFLNYAASVSDDNIVNGKIVHIPNAGSKPGTVRNRQNVPATIVKRADTDVLYLLDEFTSDPTYIDNVEQVELSYDKIDSVLGAHIATLKESMADWMIFNWLSKNTSSSAMTAAAFASGRYVMTSGGAAASANGPNSRTNQKLTAANLANARLIMNQLNIPKEGRYCLLPSIMYDELMQELAGTTVGNLELLKSADLPAGVLFKLYGFNIMERSSVALMSQSTPTVQAPGTTEASTHGYAAICWQKDMVEKAVGEIKMFENLNDPTLYGNVYSALVRAGGRARYSDAMGVVPIIQAD